MTNTKQKFGFCNGTYYKMQDFNRNVFIMDNFNYEKSSFQLEIHDNRKTCDVHLYHYHTSLLNTVNDVRVNDMKDMIVSEKIKNIDKVNNTYTIGVDYTLFSDNGNVISSGRYSVQADICDAVITSSINDDNELIYRYGLICDGQLEIKIPNVYKYGIKNPCKQHPYILKINNIGVYSTIGGTLIPSADFNVIVKRDYTTLRNGVHVSDRYCGVSSPAICAGSVGTLVMDKTVRMKSDNNFDYGETKNVIICEDSFTDEFVMKIDSDINVINISMEVLYDNMNLVSDVKTIDDLIESNNTTVNPPDDTTSDNTDEETSNDTPSDSNDVIPPSDDISNEENSSEQPEQDKGNTDNDPNDIVDTTTEEKPDISEDVTPDDNK